MLTISSKMSMDWLYKLHLKFFWYHWNSVYIIFYVFILKSENINKINRTDFQPWRICEAGYRIVSYFALCHVCDRKIPHVSYCSIAFFFVCWLNSFLQNQFGVLSSLRERLQILIIFFSFCRIDTQSVKFENGPPCISHFSFKSALKCHFM